MPPSSPPAPRDRPDHHGVPEPVAGDAPQPGASLRVDPGGKLSYKPTPAQLTIGYVAQHLANDNYFFCNNFGEMKGTRAPEDTSTPDSVKATWPKAKPVTQLKDSFNFCQDAFAQLNDRNLADGGRDRG